MTETYWSSHFKRERYELHWGGLSGSADVWRVVLGLLPAMGTRGRVFGSVDGTCRVARRGEGTSAFEEWDVDADPASLRRRLDSLAEAPEPIELSLHCRPALRLPDDSVQIVDYDDADYFTVGDATLVPASGEFEHADNPNAFEGDPGLGI